MQEMKLDEVQEAELKILMEVQEICKQENIQYWGMYGTLIGAIRHKGFIPWDDDLDLAMKREDYEKFIYFLQKKYSGKLELHIQETNSDYPYYIARVCDKEHVLQFDDFDYSSGVFIDIYPFDGMGNEKDMEFWNKNTKKIKILKKCLTAVSYKGKIGSSLLHKIINMPLVLFSKWKGKEYFIKQIDLLSKKYQWNESEYVGLPVWADNLYFHKKADFEKFMLVDFENIKISVPVNYNRILKDIYGDYMCLPPENKRVPQHGYKAYKK